jgi:hypothetical protein
MPWSMCCPEGDSSSRNVYADPWRCHLSGGSSRGQQPGGEATPCPRRTQATANTQTRPTCSRHDRQGRRDRCTLGAGGSDTRPTRSGASCAVRGRGGITRSATASLLTQRERWTGGGQRYDGKDGGRKIPGWMGERVRRWCGRERRVARSVIDEDEEGEGGAVAWVTGSEPGSGFTVSLGFLQGSQGS